MIKRLEGKVAVVTGSGQGIGRAIAVAFAEQGAKVVTNNRKPGASQSSMVTDEQIKKLSGDQLEWYNTGFQTQSGDAETTAQFIRSNGGEATAVFADITKIEDAERLISTAVERYGRIDILCNVAGGFGFCGIEDLTDELWDHVNGVKPRGYFHTIKFAVPHMRRQKTGRIINCASPAFMGGVLKQAEYCAANGGVVSLTRAVAMEVYGDGITVNCFAPAAFTRATYELEAAKLVHDKPIVIEGREFVAADDTPGPEHVAPFIVYLASDNASNVTGSVFMVMGNLVGRFAEPAMEKTLNKTGDKWDIDELFAKADAELFEGYTSLAAR